MILKTQTKDINCETIFHEGISEFSYIKLNNVINNISDLDRYLENIDLVIQDVPNNETNFENIKLLFYKKDGLRTAYITKNNTYLMNDQGQTIENIK